MALVNWKKRPAAPFSDTSSVAAGKGATFCALPSWCLMRRKADKLLVGSPLVKLGGEASVQVMLVQPLNLGLRGASGGQRRAASRPGRSPPRRSRYWSSARHR